mgnify:CR=1 FL=1
MRAILVNGQDAGVNGEGLSNMAEVIELLKSMIDPEHMITSILVDGRELEESDWSAATGKFATSILEIETGRPHDFARGRLAGADAVVRSCFLSFREARKCFQEGNMQDGNQQLIKGVNTLQAFFQWYASMVELLPPEERPGYKLDDQLKDIGETCKRICQQQLYQSWWALGETIKNQLEPQLDRLEDFCRSLNRKC